MWEGLCKIGIGARNGPQKNEMSFHNWGRDWVKCTTPRDAAGDPHWSITIRVIYFFQAKPVSSKAGIVVHGSKMIANIEHLLPVRIAAGCNLLFKRFNSDFDRQKMFNFRNRFSSVMWVVLQEGSKCASGIVYTHQRSIILFSELVLTHFLVQERGVYIILGPCWILFSPWGAN